MNMLHAELKPLQAFSLKSKFFAVNVILSCTMSEFQLNGMFTLLPNSSLPYNKERILTGT